MKPHKHSDIYDFIFELYFKNNFLAEGHPNVTSPYSGKNIWIKIKNVLERPFKFIKQSITFTSVKTEKEQIANKVWLFYHTSNNYISLAPIHKALPNDSILIGPGIPLNKIESIQIPFHQSFLYTYKFPSYWWHLYQKNRTQALKYFDLVFRCMGLYEVANQYIKKHKPSCIVLANDHSEKERAIRIAAKQYDIPVIYIQHASISQFHPRLDFDLSLLEGQASLDVYSKKGTPHGLVKLVGMPKFDHFSSLRNKNKKVRNVGICTNLIDKIKDIDNLIIKLTKRFPQITFNYRPHPSDIRSITTPINISKNESIFDFLQKQDLIIAGNTSAHLEAVLMNVVSVHYEITSIKDYDHYHDYYGYIKNDLSILAEDEEMLFNIINHQSLVKNEVYLKAQYYNAVVGTKFEGNSTGLVIQEIKQIIQSSITNRTLIDNKDIQ